jgi:hypothetical protein
MYWNLYERDRTNHVVDVYYASTKAEAEERAFNTFKRPMDADLVRGDCNADVESVQSE